MNIYQKGAKKSPFSTRNLKSFQKPNRALPVQIIFFNSIFVRGIDLNQFILVPNEIWVSA